LKKIIVNVTLQKARKSELPTIVSGVLDIVLKHDPALLKIEGFYSKLLEMYQQLYLLKQKYTKQLLDDEVRTLRKRRLTLISTILTQITAEQKADVASLRAAVMLISPVVNVHLFNLVRKTLTEIHDEVLHFTTKIKESEELMLAAEATGIKVYVNDLITIEDSLGVGSTSLRDNNSKRRIPQLQMLNARESTINAYYDLMFAIELARVENVEIDYYEMIAALNEFLVPYQAKIKSRGTRSKNSAKKTMTVAMSTTTSATAV